MTRWMLPFVAALLAAIATVALAQELKSLRGDLGVADADRAPAVSGVREAGRYDRAYRQQPPLVPHQVDKYEVDLKVNQCLRCHDWPNNVRENAPKVSETHYVDRQGKRLDQISSTRWFCTQCHVPQSDAKPLVDNAFRSALERR
jgi:cytochrome c-type protein NapB